MAELYRYAAFISYSSKDTAFAKRLHRALEGYGIPSSLGQFDLIGGGKRNRIYPVFRDREELAAGHLGDVIEANLRASAALIVVCSPNAAASPWVQKEIEYFAGQGRADKIFAIVADDAPLVDTNGADATSASFPPAFRGDVLAGDKLEPLAADARKEKDGFRNAWLKIVAGLIGVSPGQIIDRDKRRRLQRRVLVGMSCLIGVVAIAIAGVWFDTKAARSDFVARSVELSSLGHSLDAAAFSIAGFPEFGDAISVEHADAESALLRTSASTSLSLDLGELAMDRSGAKLSDDGHWLVTINHDDDEGLLRDIHRLDAAPFELGKVFRFGFSHDSNLLVIVSPDVEGTLRDLLHPASSPAVLGPTTSFGFSPDDRWLLTSNRDEQGALHDLRRPGAVLNLGPTFGFRFSPNGRWLLTQDRQSHALLRDLGQAGAAPTPLGVALAHAFSADGRWLAVLGQNGRGTLRDLGESGAALRAIDGGVAVVFSPDCRWLVVRSIDHLVLYDLGNPGGVPVSIEGASFLAFSGDSRFLAVQRDEGNVVLRDLRRMDAAPVDLGIASRAYFSNDGRWLLTADNNSQGTLRELGRAATVRSLGKVYGLAFSPDNRWLLTQDEETLGTLHDLNDPNARPRPLGPLFDSGFSFSRDGRWLITQDNFGASALRDLSLVQPVTLHHAELRAAVCHRSANAIRPFPASVRTSGASTGVGARLRGRPWNPCDWRGLLAILPNHDGDGWFEGARQWIRLVQVRYLHGSDWACSETTSRASAEIRLSRIDMCRRFAAADEAATTR